MAATCKYLRNAQHVIKKLYQQHRHGAKCMAENMLLLLQGLPSIASNKLPLAQHRSSSDRLSCSNVADVPAKAVLHLKYPIHLGTLKLPLLVCTCHLRRAQTFLPASCVTRKCLKQLQTYAKV